MENRILTIANTNQFRDYLVREERSAATVEKYLRDIRAFLVFTAGKSVTKSCYVSIITIESSALHHGEG